MSFGAMLSRTRKARGMLQKDLASGVGIAVSTLSAWEGDHRVPDVTQIRELCRLLHVSADVLLERAPFQLGPLPNETETP